MRIGAKILLTLLILGLVAISVVFISAYYLVVRQVEEQIYQHLETTAVSRTNHIRTFIDLTKGRMVDFASDGKIKDCLAAIEDGLKTCTAEDLDYHLLVNKLPAVEGLLEISALNPQGRVVSSSRVALKGEDESGQEYFLAGKNAPFLSGVFYSGILEPLLVVSAPVMKEGGLVGLIVGKIEADSFYEILLDRSGLRDSGEIIVAKRNADGDTEFVGPRRFEKAGDSSSVMSGERLDAPTNQALLENEGLFVNGTDYRGEPVLAYTQYISELGWGVVAKIDKEEAFGILNKLAWSLGLTGSFSLLLFVLSSIWLTNKVVQPIRQIEEEVKRIEAGKLSYQLELKGKDEIAQLSQAFGRMVLAVKRSREEIDQKVDDQVKIITTKQKDLEDQRKALLNVLEDVEREREKSEGQANELKKFELAVENAFDQIIITDNEGTILYANRATEEITGFSKKEVLGKKAGTKKLWGGLMNKEFYKKLWKTIKVDKKSFAGEIQNRRKNGEKYTAFTTLSPVLNKDGKTIFFVGIERDISREAEIDRMKTEFISLASHQLRTPLSAIKWFLELLRGEDVGKLNKEQQQYLHDINASNERMIALVNDLLNISRIESGRIIIEPQPTNLNKLVKNLLVELSPQISGQKLKLSYQFKPAPFKIKIDSEMIREVYKNLIVNAIVYTPKGGRIKLEISKKNDLIVSEISDNGLGIPEKEKVKVFQKFFRGSNVVKIDTEGTGLGLYLVKSILDSCDGRIWFESKEKKGTTFWFSLPLSGVPAKKGEVRLTENGSNSAVETKKSSSEAEAKKEKTQGRKNKQKRSSTKGGGGSL